MLIKWELTVTGEDVRSHVEIGVLLNSADILNTIKN